MKISFKKILITILFLTPLVVPAFSTPSSYAAAEYQNLDEENSEENSSQPWDCNDILLGLKPWSCGTSDITSEESLKTNIIIIVTNVLTDLTIIAAYLVIGFVIYGGYQYMFSSGDPGKAANGKKTILHAFIGLAIVMSANIILSSIRIALLGQSGTLVPDPDSSANANALVTNLIQWVIGISGLVAAVFLVIGGISYITSSGDSAQLQKAKNTILYALIGLVIVALAEVATAFVSNLIRESQKSQPTAQIITRKEIS